MKNGWIKLYRTLLDSAVFADAELLRVLLYCVLQASYRVMNIPVGRQVITLQPGQLLYGRKVVSSRLGIGEGKLRSMMHQLEQMGIIKIESSNRYSVVTVLQWDAYQNETNAAVFPFDCDFLDEGEPVKSSYNAEELAADIPDKLNLHEIVQDKNAVKKLLESVNDNQQKSVLLTALEAAFDESVTGKEPADSHKQEEKKENKLIIKKESDSKELMPRAALRAVRRYRRADGENVIKGESERSTATAEGHSVPGGKAAVPCGNSAETFEDASAAICHDDMIEMQYDFPDTEQLAQMEYAYWQQYEWYHADECNLTLPADGADVLQELNKIYEQERMEQQNQVDLKSLTWDIEDDKNWGVDVTAYTNLSETTIDEIDSDEQAWIAAHQLFNQLWNKYPVKEGKHKVSDVQIMELYEVGREAMIQAINRYKEKKRRVPKKYWMNGSTFFNGGYREYLL